MEKSTTYLVITIILAVTVLGVAGEYFAYKYYSLFVTQPAAQSGPQTGTSGIPGPAVSQLPTGSSEKSITNFYFKDPPTIGKIDESGHTIIIAVPAGTDVTKIVPTIEISKDAAITPSSDIPQDFTNPVAYLVTAQDGTTQQYSAQVNITPSVQSVEKLITSFKLSGLSPEVDGYIDNNTHTVYATVPDGTDLTDLTPVISASDGATISPESGASQDFTGPVTYTITDSYGGKQTYTVNVVTQSNSY